MQNFDMVKAMLPQAEVYVYDHENSIQGFVGLSGDYIEGLFVSSGCQSCGIGALLLNHIKEDSNDVAAESLSEEYACDSFLPAGRF